MTQDRGFSIREERNIMHSASGRSLLLAGTLSAFLPLRGRRRATAGRAAQQPAAPAQLPAGSPLIGRPNTGRCDEARAGPRRRQFPRLPTTAGGELKLPPGFKLELYAFRRRQRAHAAARRQGHGVRQQPPEGQDPRHRREGRQARGQGAPLGLYRPNGIVLHNGTL